MATGNFNIYATIGGRSSRVSRLGLEEEERGLAFAKQIFEEGKASGVRVTVEVADPQTGRKSTSTVVVHRREDKPRPGESAGAGAAASAAKAAGAGGRSTRHQPAAPAARGTPPATPKAPPPKSGPRTA